MTKLFFTSSRIYRFFEIIPGAMVWLTLIGAVLLSFFKPLWAIYFIIIFDFYWLIRVGYLLVYMISSWRKYRKTLAIDWYAKLNEYKEYHDIWHVIFLPTYHEPYEVLYASLQALIKNQYPKEKFIVVLAGEERDKENFLSHASRLQAEFADQFGHFLITVHPSNIVGELAGKGSNINWAGHRAQELIDQLKIPYENIIVSTFDVDTVAHVQYFAYLTYTFLNHPDKLHTSYQPLAIYNNNMWQSSAIARVVANSTTFWLLTDLARPERLFTFSSHSMPFKALVDVNFWANDMVSEDSHIFLQCFIHYHGRYQVTPLYLPVSMDTAYTGSFWKSVKNQYLQQRRWAYGVENFPYMAWHFWRSSTIPFAKKFRYLWNQLEGVYSWATAPLIIFILGRLPLQFADNEIKSTLIAHNAPVALGWLMRLAMVGLLFSAILSTILMPPRPREQHWVKYVSIALQWVLFPICMLIFGAIPSTDAQTRLMLGKYLGFFVTQKSREPS